MSSAYTGNRAEQVMNGTAIRVAMRSRRSGITRVPMMAGTAQAKPDNMGTNEWPERPHQRMSRSTRNAARAM